MSIQKELKSEKHAETQDFQENFFKMQEFLQCLVGAGC